MVNDIQRCQGESSWIIPQPDWEGFLLEHNCSPLLARYRVNQFMLHTIHFSNTPKPNLAEKGRNGGRENVGYSLNLEQKQLRSDPT